MALKAVAEEVMTEFNLRSDLGRVVVNPPKRMAPLELHDTLPMYLCCGRAFLSEESYARHKDETTVHGKPIDLTRVRTSINDRSSIAFWKTRKLNPTKRMEDFEQDDEEGNKREGNNNVDEGEGDWDRDDDDDEMLPVESNQEKKKLKKVVVTSKKRLRGYKKCTLCLLSMPSTNMRRHLRTCHNPENQFPCSYCSCRLLSAYGKMIHELKAHKLTTAKMAKKKSLISAHLNLKKLVRKPIEPVTDPLVGRGKVRCTKLGPGSFQCNVCSKTFNCSRSATNHLNVHFGVKPFKCPQCTLSFAFKSSVGRHIKTCHVIDGSFSCPYDCGCVMSNQVSLQMHANLCKKRLEEQQAAEDSGEVVIKEEPQEDVPPPTQPTRKKLIPTVTSEVPLDIKGYQVAPNIYHCDICNKDITCSGNFRDHLNSHAGSRPHKCPLCHLTFTFRSNIKRHIRTSHVNNGQFFCVNKCGCKFVSEIALKGHMYTCRRKLIMDGHAKNVNILSAPRKVVPKFPLPKMVPMPHFSRIRGSGIKSNFKCKECGKMLLSSRNLRNHMLIHMNLKPFNCDICGLPFRAVESLRKHKDRSHVSNGAFRCPDCPCRFMRSQGLHMHTKMYHSGPQENTETQVRPMPSLKPMPKMLGNGMRQKDNEMATEIKTEHPFQCNICHKVLQSQSSLRNHGLIHTGAKPFSCEFCGHKFRLYSTLYDHKKTSHSGGSFACNKCSCSFESEHGLTRHQGVYHNFQSPKYARRRALTIKKKALKLTVTKHHPPAHFQSAQARFARRAPVQPVMKPPPPKLIPQPLRQSFKMEVDDDSEGFECGDCGVKLQTLQALSDHQRIHTQPQPQAHSTKASLPDKSEILCTICSQRMHGASHLKRHMVTNHSGGAFQCPNCPCDFHSQISLSGHITRFHGSDAGSAQTGQVVIQVDSTESDFGGFEVYDDADEDEIQEIHYDQIPEGQYEDDVMEEMQYGDDAIQDFDYGDEGEGTPEVYYDNDEDMSQTPVISNPQTVQSRFKPDTTSTRLSCDVCGKTFRSPSTLKDHKTIHENRKPYECSICFQKFRISSILSNHKKKSHGNGKHVCKDCPCRFATSKGLSVHRFVYHKGGRIGGGDNETPDELPEEEVSFNEDENGQFEENEDIDEAFYPEIVYSPPVKSPPVAPVAVVKPQPKMLKFSPKDRPIKCKECNQIFLGPTKLQEHVELNHPPSPQDSPVECSGCGNYFNGKADLLIHIKTNDGNPFKCAYCCVTLTTIEGLQEHFENFHGEVEEEDPEFLESNYLSIPIPKLSK